MTKVRLEYTVSIYAYVELEDLDDRDVAHKYIEHQLNYDGISIPPVAYHNQVIYPAIGDVQYYGWGVVGEDVD